MPSDGLTESSNTKQRKNKKVGRDRLLLIDACISNKVALILRNRGAESLSLSHLGLKDLGDPAILRVIDDEYPECVFVTADDHMPVEHHEEVELFRPTLAIIDPKVGKGYEQQTDEEAWKWEVCMRWAHRMQDQEPHTIKRYNAGGGRTWRKPRTPRSIDPGQKKPRVVRKPSDGPVPVAKPYEDYEQLRLEED